MSWRDFFMGPRGKSAEEIQLTTERVLKALKEADMSWRALDEQSTKLTGQSKVEFDNALPHLKALVLDNFALAKAGSFPAAGISDTCYTG